MNSLTEKLENQFAETKLQQQFHIGQRVKCKDRTDDKWKAGTITALYPLISVAIPVWNDNVHTWYIVEDDSEFHEQSERLYNICDTIKTNGELLEQFQTEFRTIYGTIKYNGNLHYTIEELYPSHNPDPFKELNDKLEILIEERERAERENEQKEREERERKRKKQFENECVQLIHVCKDIHKEGFAFPLQEKFPEIGSIMHDMSNFDTLLENVKELSPSGDPEEMKSLTEKLKNQFAETKLQQQFHIGQRVKCKDHTNDNWKAGIITELYPLISVT